MTFSSGTGSKTVYILGAGFSRVAGFPLQAEILDRVDGFGILDLPLDPFTQDYLLPYGKWCEFRRKALPPGDTPALEDVFTLLDQTISSRGFCAGYSSQALAEVREALKKVILCVFHSAGERIGKEASGFYQSVAAYLLERRVAAGQGGDPFSVVSLNWDCLLEDTIYQCIERMKAYGAVDIDYCCYTTRIDEGCPHTPSLLQKAKGLFNVKVMKLHGSANWLLCPNCNQLYTGVGGEENVWKQYVRPRTCPNCEKVLSAQAEPRSLPELEAFFITPTFIKVFDSPHIRMSWHNAYMELAEAREVVFIGYSLPQADYHVRTLLRRAIQPEAWIVVVLTSRDKPNRNTDRRLRPYFAATRFSDFFGPERVTFELGGVETYFRRAIGRKSLSARLRSLRRLVEQHRTRK